MITAGIVFSSIGLGWCLRYLWEWSEKELFVEKEGGSNQ